MFAHLPASQPGALPLSYSSGSTGREELSDNRSTAKQPSKAGGIPLFKSAKVCCCYSVPKAQIIPTNLEHLLVSMYHERYGMTGLSLSFISSTKRHAQDRPMSLWISSLQQLEPAKHQFSPLLWDFMSAAWPSTISVVVPRGERHPPPPPLFYLSGWGGPTQPHYCIWTSFLGGGVEAAAAFVLGL